MNVGNDPVDCCTMTLMTFKGLYIHRIREYIDFISLVV